MSRPLRPRMKVWVVFPAGTELGDGRARKIEAAAGFTILTRRPGGGGAGGARLAREGRAFLARYRRFRQSIGATVQSRFAMAFALRRVPRGRRGRWA